MSTLGYWLRLAWFKAGWVLIVMGILGLIFGIASPSDDIFAMSLATFVAGGVGAAKWADGYVANKRPIHPAVRRAEVARQRITDLERETSEPLADLVARAERKAERSYMRKLEHLDWTPGCDHELHSTADRDWRPL